MTAPANPPARLRYRDSGVNIDAGNELARRLKPIARATHGETNTKANILGGVGGFGALVELPAKFKRPVLVSATDGVGTKLRLAGQLGRDHDIGIDLVAMCVNDLLACGAEPLFFLDYYATGELDVARAETVIRGIARGCRIAGCALVGGETAEMPGLYAAGDYDLAGFAVGVADKDKLLDPARVRPGDAVLGLAASGPHANGFSLIRKIVERSGADLFSMVGDATLADHLLAPTRIYVKSLLGLLGEVKVSAVAHITGGGLIENPPRVLPLGVAAEIHRTAWQMPPVFTWLQQTGAIDDTEMLRTFNCGIGMVVVVRQADAAQATSLLQQTGETVFPLGQIIPADPADPAPRVVVRD